MKKLSIMSLIFLISVSNIFGKNDDMFTTSKDWLQKQPYKKTNQAFVLSFALRYINGKEGAERYNKYVQFYTTTPTSTLDKETLIDLAVFPAIDHAVSYAMVPVKGLVYVRGLSKRVSPDSLNFLLNNMQLATSAGLTKMIQIGAEDGSKGFNMQNLKNFGKACATQVACDAVDEAVIKPLVQTVVGDDKSLVGFGAHVLANMAFVYYFAGK